MIKTFTPKDIMTNKGCYSKEQVEILSFIKQDIISILDILNSEIPLKDKRWYLWNKCDITLQDKKDLSLKLAWCVFPIYQNKYPNDKRVEDCLKAIKDFNDGRITIDELRIKRTAASTATSYATYAAYAASNYAADAADAADTYAADAYAAYAYAAYTADAYTTADAYSVAAAYAAADAAADDAAAYAADAAYAANAYAADAANAYAAGEQTYIQKILNILIEFVNNN